LLSLSHTAFCRIAQFLPASSSLGPHFSLPSILYHWEGFSGLPHPVYHKPAPLALKSVPLLHQLPGN
jgi:hypothetical protein